MERDVDRLVAQFQTADQKQKEATAVVSEMAEVKLDAILALREAGLTFAAIGRLVGLSLAGVQKIAYKAREGAGW